MGARPRLAAAPRIGLREAKIRFDQGAALFVDVRSGEEYERSHIPGAISLPIREILRRAEEVPRERPVIFY